MTLFETISAAINDMSERGYVSPEQLAYWIARIRKAALESLTPPHELSEMLNRLLQANYKRLADDGKIMEMHPGVSRFTLEKVKPQLRAELNRRIMASADLIKLNREEAIDKTIQRFSGWATSIPPGGSDVTAKRETNTRIRKSLTQLPFEERRVLIDQGHKLTSNLSEILAHDGGALAGRWHSNWRQPGYNYRKDHKERDDVLYVVRDNWAIKAGLMRRGGPYTDQITKPAEEPFCFPGDSKIPFAHVITKGYRRWFSGELTVIRTASGKSLRATPNHPVLTRGGWKAVGELKKGDDIVEVSNDGISILEEDQNYNITSISEIFCALNEFCVSQSFDLSTASFHGDGMADSQVDIVGSARRLGINWKTGRLEIVEQLPLPVSDCAGTRQGDLFSSARKVLNALQRGVGSLSKALSPIWAYTFHAQGVGVGYGAQNHPSTGESMVYDRTADAGSSRYREGALPGQISVNDFGGIEKQPRASWKLLPQPDPDKSLVGGGGIDTEEIPDFSNGLPFTTQASKIVSVERQEWSGHVFNLETESGWYVADGIITHNCRCKYRWVYGLRGLPESMLTAKGKAELARVRAEIANRVA